jgi:hypothetical protein
VACTEHDGNADTVLVGISEESVPLGQIWPRWEDDINPGLKQKESASIGFRWTRLGTSGRFFEHGDEPSRFSKESDFLYSCTNLELVKSSELLLIHSQDT